MLSLEESLKILKETDALLEGHFILSSGLRSSKYVQCAQLMSKPKHAVKIIRPSLYFSKRDLSIQGLEKIPRPLIP